MAPRKSTPQERNPFADSASMLLRVLLSSPPKAWGIRELARMAGASPALSMLTLRRLERLGYVSRESTGQARLLDPAQLLREWAAWYVTRRLEAYRFKLPGATKAQDVLGRIRRARRQLPGRWALTSMAGASLVAPFATFSEVHVHLPKADSLARAWQDALGLVPDELGGVHLVEPYYSDSGTFEAQVHQSLPVVSPLQLYLDCYRYPVRGREQAEHILAHVLIPRWKRGR